MARLRDECWEPRGVEQIAFGSWTRKRLYKILEALCPLRGEAQRAGNSDKSKCSNHLRDILTDVPSRTAQAVVCSQKNLFGVEFSLPPCPTLMAQLPVTKLKGESFDSWCLTASKLMQRAVIFPATCFP